MLGKREVDSQKVDTLIGKETQVMGKITTNGTLRIDGLLQGELNSRGDLVVGQGGRVQADIQARNVLVAGEVKGNIKAQGIVEISPSGRLEGDVQVASLAIAEGGFFLGNCQMSRGKQPGTKEN